MVTSNDANDGQKVGAQKKRSKGGGLWLARLGATESFFLLPGPHRAPRSQSGPLLLKKIVVGCAVPARQTVARVVVPAKVWPGSSWKLRNPVLVWTFFVHLRLRFAPSGKSHDKGRSPLRRVRAHRTVHKGNATREARGREKTGACGRKGTGREWRKRGDEDQGVREGGKQRKGRVGEKIPTLGKSTFVLRGEGKRLMPRRNGKKAGPSWPGEPASWSHA